MTADKHSVVVQRICDDQTCPGEQDLQRWATAVMSGFGKSGEVTLRIVAEPEIRKLNSDFRQQDKSTNVLSFAADDEFGIEHGLLGDVVICAPVVAHEASEQGKNIDAHWAHMVTHGILHLLGFDHEDDREASEMEAHEKRILAGFGFADPYATPDYQQHGN